jgi:hypothetical protein
LDLNAVRLPFSEAPDRAREHATARHRPEDAGEDDLARLESSIEWLKREATIARLETKPSAREKNQRLPRAGQLTPVSGMRPANAESSSPTRKALIFELTPPRAHERLQLPPPRREHRSNLRAALYILIASGIAGSIAYHFSAGGLIPASEVAQAARL